MLRREVPAEIDQIDEVHRMAFATPPDGDEPVEVTLVHALRAEPFSTLPLVAEDGDGYGRRSRRVLPRRSTAPRRRPRPHRRTLTDNLGIGVGLMHAGIAGTETLDYPLVALLGYLDYYSQKPTADL